METTCEWCGAFIKGDVNAVHLDVDHDLRAFCIDTCGFRPTNAALVHL